LRNWGYFPDATGSPRFPVRPEAPTRREASTFKQYVAHVRAACEVAGHGTDWFNCPIVRRAREGLKRANLVFKGPRLAVRGHLALRMGCNVAIGHQQKFFCVLSWVSFTRAWRGLGPYPSEPSRCPTGPMETFRTPWGDRISRRRSRYKFEVGKNRIGGDAVARSCACSGAKGVNAHVPNSLCPIHAMWPWVCSHAGEGGPLFSDGIASWFCSGVAADCARGQRGPKRVEIHPTLA